MAKYVYQAFLTREGNAYNVDFPDLDGCYTCGSDLADALAMAEDVLNGYLSYREDHGESIAPATMNHVAVDADEMVTLVTADTEAYRRKLSRRSIKKTLTIPMWMNEAAEKQGINFSQVLQEALSERLAAPHA